MQPSSLRTEAVLVVHGRRASLVLTFTLGYMTPYNTFWCLLCFRLAVLNLITSDEIRLYKAVEHEKSNFVEPWQYVCLANKSRHPSGDLTGMGRSGKQCFAVAVRRESCVSALLILCCSSKKCSSEFWKAKSKRAE